MVIDVYSTIQNSISEIFLGVKTLALGISQLILLPLHLFGINIPILFVQILYLALVFWIIWKIVGDFKLWVSIIIVLLLLSTTGFFVN